jgi:carboxyl-terminal processing protease
VSRRTFLFLLVIALPAGFWVPGARAVPVFDAATAASVWGAALSYIAPRSLEALSLPQMTIWGLNGLTALDPDLNTTLQDNQLRLYGPDQLLIAVAAPAAQDAAGWGTAAAAVAQAAFDASPPLQQAGTQGVIDSFFDELFNHFDPYSRYEPPLEAAQNQLMITGIAGSGLTLGRHGNDVVVAAVAAAGPAAEAGVTVGALVRAIDGKPVSASQIATLNDDLNGILGSNVTLRLADPADPASSNDVTLTRAYVPPQTVFNNSDAAQLPGVLVLKISGFNRGTSEQFSALLVAGMAADPPPDGVIIDLRGNRGGVLRQAVLIADTLLSSGKIAQAAGRDPDADQNFLAEGSDVTGGLPIIVLVDGQSASAAEILAAALADDRRAVVVGSETLGKGLVQTVTSLPDGGELYVTWSRVLAPRGWPLQTMGVLPQLCTSLGDRGLREQLAALAKGQNLLAGALAQARAARAPVALREILNIRNQCPADIGGSLDFTAAANLLAQPAMYRAALLPPSAVGG